MNGRSEMGQNRNVLVVEDNPVNQKVILAMLEHYGLQVDIADNGLVAMDKIAKKQFDIIFMDCQMPEMDGFETTRSIRQAQGNSLTSPDVTIIAMTANTAENDEKACYEAGMNDFISKPVDLAVIGKTLEKWHGSN